jgi:transcriptional regulator with XRE-family HTH domain
VASIDKEQSELPPFAVKLKEMREAAGMTQAQLAEASGLHVSVVFKIEQGVRADPSWATVKALAKALGTDCTAFDDDAKNKTKAKRKT